MERKQLAKKIGEVSELTGVSVRTLHHHDDIGLVIPSGRSEAGYRLYNLSDMERLQQVLLYRELDFAISDIQKMLDDPGFDVVVALTTQRALLQRRLIRTHDLIAAVNAALHFHQKESDMTDTLTPEERFALFGEFDPAKYEEEVKDCWSGPYAESAQRTQRYSNADWQNQKAEADDIFTAIAAIHQAGVAPMSEPAMDLAERHRLHIDRWFYPCSKTIHAGIGDLYDNDPRFAANINKYCEGLAQYARLAWLANSARLR